METNFKIRNYSRSFSLYSYEEAKSKVAVLIKKCKSAPPEDEIKRIKRKMFWLPLAFYLIYSLVLIVLCVLVIRSETLKQLIGYFFIEIGLLLCLIFQNNRFKKYSFLVKAFNKEYANRYKGINLFCSKKYYMKKINNIILNTDIVNYEIVKLEHSVSKSVVIHYEEDINSQEVIECCIELKEYNRIGNDNVPIFKTEKISFI